MPNTDHHHDEPEPMPLLALVDDESAQDLSQPIDATDWLAEVRAVVIDARRLESAAEWSAAMEANAADEDAVADEDEDWCEPPEDLAGDQDEEADEELVFREESRAILLEVDEIIVGAMRVQEDATPNQAAAQDELTPAAPDVAVEAMASLESADVRDAEPATPSGAIAGEIESRPETTGTDTRGAAPRTPKSVAKRADKRSSSTRGSGKGSR